MFGQITTGWYSNEIAPYTYKENCIAIHIKSVNRAIGSIRDRDTTSTWVIEEGVTVPYLRWIGKTNDVLKATLDTQKN